MQTRRWRWIVAIALGLGGVACGAATTMEWRRPATASSVAAGSEADAHDDHGATPAQFSPDGGLPSPFYFDAGGSPIPLGR